MTEPDGTVDDIDWLKLSGTKARDVETGTTVMFEANKGSYRIVRKLPRRSYWER